MKKNIIILLLLFTAGVLSGQQNYYWSAGKKQFLTGVENKFVVKLSSSVSSQQTEYTLLTVWKIIRKLSTPKRFLCTKHENCQVLSIFFLLIPLIKNRYTRNGKDIVSA